MQPSPELINKVAEWRRKVADNTITLEEMQQAVAIMRGGRMAATQAAAASKAKGRSKAPPRDAADMLSELGI